MNINNLAENHNYLREKVLKLIPNFTYLNEIPKKKLSNKEKTNAEYFDEKISINQLDYYHTNAISRSSKTMAECKNTKNNNLKNGTYN